MKIRDQKSIQIIHELLEENGNIPNNRNCELIVYQKAIEFEGNEGPEMMEELFYRNDWKNSWRNGIFSYHHYHSNTHEVLGIYSGYAEVVLGGEKGIDLQRIGMERKLEACRSRDTGATRTAIYRQLDT